MNTVHIVVELEFNKKIFFNLNTSPIVSLMGGVIFKKWSEDRPSAEVEADNGELWSQKKRRWRLPSRRISGKRWHMKMLASERDAGDACVMNCGAPRVVKG